VRVGALFTRIIAASAVTAAVALLAACPARESIDLVNRDPGRFHGREITIAGRVVNSFAIMGEGVYELDDGTGRLWVFSDKYGVPGRSRGVAVTGRIEQGLSLGGRNFPMILRETRRRG